MKFLSEWLQLWQKKGSPTSRGCIDEDTCLTHDDGYYCLQSDCDSDTPDGDDSLKNVLLVTGPVGVCSRFHQFPAFPFVKLDFACKVTEINWPDIGKTAKI